MGLFDSIRNAVGGSDDGGEDDGATLLDSTTLDPTDFRERAERVADADGLDFSLSSLDLLDRRVTTLESRETADDATAATTYTERTVDFGSYLGEVLVRAYDGTWVRDDGWGVSVAGPDDEVTVSVFEVAVRSLESDPVFAAVVERLEAELSLDAADPDMPDGTADESGAEDADGADDADDAATGGTEATASEADHEDDASVGPDAGDLTVDSFSDPEDESESTEEPSAAESEAATDEGAAPDAADSSGDADDAVESPGAPTDADDSLDDTDAADESPGDTDAADPSPTDLIGEAEPDAADADDRDATGPVVAPEPDDREVPGDEPTADDSGTAADVTDADPTAGDGLRAEYAETAQEFASFWSEHDLDFSPASLARLDDLVDGEWEQARFRDATFGSEADFDDRAFTSIVTELGSYFGEVLVRDLDGEWTDETDHVAAVLVPTGSGPLAVPVFQVAMNSLRQSAVLERSYDALLEDIDR